MDRHKRNSIAGIPTRTDLRSLHDNYDGNAGGGPVDKVTGLPSQVGRVFPSSYRALISAFSCLTRLDDFSCEWIGSGFFSEVYKAHHRASNQVMALKMNKLSSNKANMLREVQLMNRLNHPNILRLKGSSAIEEKSHVIRGSAVMERKSCECENQSVDFSTRARDGGLAIGPSSSYINGGNLEQLLDSNKPLNWACRVKMAGEIASGVAYLHSKGIFHRDLTSKNCLIKSDESGYTAVVGDFGLAEKIPTLGDELYNEKADVFSYGIILCEIIARIQNFGLDYHAFQHMVGDCPPDFLQLAFNCCNMDPKLRPSFPDIVGLLEELLCRVEVEEAEADRIHLSEDGDKKSTAKEEGGLERHPPGRQGSGEEGSLERHPGRRRGLERHPGRQRGLEKRGYGETPRETEGSGETPPPGRQRGLERHPGRQRGLEKRGVWRDTPGDGGPPPEARGPLHPRRSSSSSENIPALIQPKSPRPRRNIWLSRSQSDIFARKAGRQVAVHDPYYEAPPSPDGPPSPHPHPPHKVNPFSAREDLRGGHVKFFDVPSRSVFSHMACRSLPVSPCASGSGGGFWGPAHEAGPNNNNNGSTAPASSAKTEPQGLLGNEVWAKRYAVVEIPPFCSRTARGRREGVDEEEEEEEGQWRKMSVEDNVFGNSWSPPVIPEGGGEAMD
ncbi:hypothetical protein NHX12_003701 [Muraenolepis orangiensis]|uniref:dual-specificity kinase n=1 Tax=Muraenolepis orangiensis TaxID=630683 RepID=A0A9Q0DRK4_9TELE|nr:hypothetical protein NHX12_003701 [Muraenolepis orangiensis]